MSDSDNEFALPDNSKSDRPAPPSFASTPTPVVTPSEALPVGFPGQSNADYASGLLAARRRGLQQQQQSATRPVTSGTPPLVSTRKVSPVLASAAASTPSHFNVVAPTSSTPLASTPTSSFVPQAAASAAPDEIASADEALFRALDANPIRQPVAGRRGNSATPEPATSLTAQMSGGSVYPAVVGPADRSPTMAPPSVASSQPQPQPQMQPPQVAPPVTAPPVDPEKVEKLRAQVDAKRKLLQQIREREQAMVDKTRAEKAKKVAELQALESEVRRVWETVESEKNKFEGDFRRQQDDQEAMVRQERQRIEAEETAKFTPVLEELQTRHRELQQEETLLRQQLSGASSNRTTVTVAVSNAVNEILSRVKGLFESGEASDGSGLSLQEWEESVRRMVRSEIKTAFASSVAEAANTERGEFAKSFEEMLRFWKECEDEEQHHITKMDEQLLLDLQAMAHEDLDRLQREEHSLEELFMGSREEWATQHRKILHEDLEASLARRTKELEAQRALRLEAHEKRAKEVEAQHRRQLEHVKEVHQSRLALIRQEHELLERVHDAKVDSLARIREASMKASQQTSESVDVLQMAFVKLKELKLHMDELRGQIDRDRQRSLELREATLSDVQGLIVSQAAAVEQERSALSASLVKLEVTQAAVDRQLEQERLWAAEAQAKLERQRSEWEREYRRWQHVSAQEKRHAEQRFSDTLLQLSDAASQLEDESREIEVQGNAIRRSCAARTAALAEDLAMVQKKEADLSHKEHDLMVIVAELEAKSRAMSSEWQRISEERQLLAVQRAELEREEQKLLHMTEQLDLVKRQVDQTEFEVRDAALRSRSAAQQFEQSRETTRTGLQRAKRAAENLADMQQRSTVNSHAESLSMQQQQSSRFGDRNPQSQQLPSWTNPNRLPLKILAELRQSLKPAERPAAASGAAGPSRVHPAHHHEDPHRRPQAAGSMPTAAATAVEDELTQTGGASSYHFTNLVGVSDAETTSVSQQTTSTSK